MIVRVRLFAVLRERAGAAELELELPDGARVRDALDAVAGLAGGLPLVMAVNRIYAKADEPLHAGDELALIPPVSGGAPGARPQGGGAPGARAQITGKPLSADAIRKLVADPRAGAIVLFEGVTREIDHLDYEAYEEMALEAMERILDAAVARHELCSAAAWHRVGQVALGEPAVLVAASAPHRPAAFAGAREIIDALKAQAPIWKREQDWVEGVPPRA